MAVTKILARRGGLAQALSLIHILVVIKVPQFLSPVYAFTDRGGCWFCPNAKRKELRHLYDHHPELWARMLELQAMPGKVSEKFNRTERFSDIDAAFRKEDALCQKAA